MELNYKLNIKNVTNDVYDDVVTSNSSLQKMYVFKTNNSYILRTNSPFISNFFKPTGKLVNNYKLKDNFLTGYEKFNNLLDNNKIKFNKEIFPITDVHSFIEKYKYNLSSNKNKFPIFLNEEDFINVLVFKNNQLIKLSEADYKLNFKSFTVDILNSEYIDIKLFIVYFKKFFEYEKTSNDMEISLDKLYTLDSGFYNIYPRYPSNIVNFNKQSKYAFTLNADTSLSIITDLNINFDNYSSNYFETFPNLNVNLTYTRNNFTPLTSITKFEKGREYVVFKLEGTTYVAKYLLSSEGTVNQEFNLLMKSHEEFKKPYFVVGNYSNGKILNNSQVTEKFKIYNKEFDVLLSLNNTQNIIKIKI